MSLDMDPAQVKFRYLSVTSAMFFPDDDAARHRFFAASIAKAAEAVLDRVPPELTEEADLLDIYKLARGASDYDDLVEAGLRCVRRNSMKGKRSTGLPLLPGQIAGDAMLIPLLCNLKYGRTDIGLHAAFRTILEDTTSNEPQGMRSLQKVWKRFESVAHLWAAELMIISDGNFSMEEGDQAIFFTIAEFIRVWGEQFIPFRSKETILNRQITLKLPDEWLIPMTLDIDVVDLSDASKRLLGLPIDG